MQIIRCGLSMLRMEPVEKGARKNSKIRDVASFTHPTPPKKQNHTNPTAAKIPNQPGRLVVRPPSARRLSRRSRLSRRRLHAAARPAADAGGSRDLLPPSTSSPARLRWCRSQASRGRPPSRWPSSLLLVAPPTLEIGFEVGIESWRLSTRCRRGGFDLERREQTSRETHMYYLNFIGV